MIYTQLPKSYKYDIIAEAIYAREIEHFHYDFDRRNFEILNVSLPDGAYKIDVESRIADTLMQMEKVENIYSALMSQIDDQEAYEEAVIAATKIREEAKNEVHTSAK
jgi:hypothetical protein